MTPPTTSASDTGTLIDYIEIWTPSEPAEGQTEGVQLNLHSAIALAENETRAVDVSNSQCDKGVGIAGSAWQQEAPVIMQGENAIALQTVRQEAGVAIEALLAFPVYYDFKLINVIVFGLSKGNGGLEIWTRDDRDELAISGSYYKGLKSFEYISQFVRFPKGAGLPGACWKESRPKIVQQPDVAPNFIRSFDRDPSHLAECIGLPIRQEYGFPSAVLLFLADASKPFANLTGVWQCSDSPSTDSDEAARSISVVAAEGDADFSWRQPICDELAKTNASLLVDSESSLLPPGSKAGLFVPFFDGKRITDVFVMLF